jgi:hypothetical protein
MAQKSKTGSENVWKLNGSSIQMSIIGSPLSTTFYRGFVDLCTAGPQIGWPSNRVSLLRYLPNPVLWSANNYRPQLLVTVMKPNLILMVTILKPFFNFPIIFYILVAFSNFYN